MYKVATRRVLTRGYHKNGTKPIKKLVLSQHLRPTHELDIKTVGIYAHEDRLSLHPTKSDESYCIGKGQSPVRAYLNIPEIIDLAKKTQSDAIHPGYGFLSENSQFATACEDNGIKFIGPPSKILKTLGDKTASKQVAILAGVSCIPGSESIQSSEDAIDIAQNIGFPCIIKASFGGGGRGMRIVRNTQELKEAMTSASQEALSCFGDGSIFVEKYIEDPKHVEVQILGDNFGDIIHLFERDCSIQRRYQKMLEIAPCISLATSTRNAIIEDAVKIANQVGYRNAGTVEFLVDRKGNHYFIEVNPRIQVEHTITEEITGVDLVKSQIQIACGMSLKELGLTQDSVQPRGVAIQCRVTTEDPKNDFCPETGKISGYCPGEGFGIRHDSANLFPGMSITPHFDSLLTKITAHGSDFVDAKNKLERALTETKISGIKTNIPFIRRILQHHDFIHGDLTTSFVPKHPELFHYSLDKDPASQLLNFLGNNIVNGCSIAGANQNMMPPHIVPSIPPPKPIPSGQRDALLRLGPKDWSASLMKQKGVLLMDTTMRDAHQSLLATRMRTKDLLAIAPETAYVLSQLYSLEMWGGATFDVALRFLHECPWDRLDQLREAIPNIPFQMLLRGANAVGYTSYPDNLVYEFVRESKNHGIDIFRIFDSLNYFPNLQLGIDAVGEAGGVIEAAICYTGDIEKHDTKYNLEYYLKLVRKLVETGIHVLSIKDMSGLLKPNGSSLLIGQIHKEFPNLPIHVHTHDTSGTGVASMIAAASSGAKIVDVCSDALSGLTSQPCMGAVIASLAQSPLDTRIPLQSIQELNDYWEQTRIIYSPFESGQKSAGSDVYFTEMPGGQYTNLLFQAQSLGIGDQWPKVKKAYAEANLLLGDIIKVTPSSKVVGDLAQFMVTNNLSSKQVVEKAPKLDFPTSVVEFFEGLIGIPEGGFPEPLKIHVLKGRQSIQGRPGESLSDFDFASAKTYLETKFPTFAFKDVDILSYGMYPKVFEEYVEFQSKYGNVDKLDTFDFLKPLDVGREITVKMDKGNTFYVKYIGIGETNKDGFCQVFFEVNGIQRAIRVFDEKAKIVIKKKEMADPNAQGSIGAPMPGVVVSLFVADGQIVNKGDALVLMSAMKMETTIRSPCNGKVNIKVAEKDQLQFGELIANVTQ